MNNTVNISSYIFEATIANQQIQYYILKEEYENLNGRSINEGLDEIGEWISQKVSKAAKFLRMIWDKIVTFVTKTFPRWVKKIWNGILEFLNIKEKPKTYDPDKIVKATTSDKQTTTENAKEVVKTEIAKASKAVSLLTYAKNATGAPKLQIETKSNGNEGPKLIEDKSKPKSVKDLKFEDIFKKATAQKEESCKKLLLIAETLEPAGKQEVKKAVDSIKANQIVVPQIEAQKPKKYITGMFLDVNVVFQYISVLNKIQDAYNNRAHDLKYLVDRSGSKFTKNKKSFTVKEKKNSVDLFDDDYLAKKNESSDYKVGSFCELQDKYCKNAGITPQAAREKKKRRYDYANLTKVMRDFVTGKIGVWESTKTSKKMVEEALSALEQDNAKKRYGAKAVNNALNNITKFSKEMSLLIKEETDYVAYVVNEYGSFLVGAKRE